MIKQIFIAVPAFLFFNFVCAQNLSIQIAPGLMNYAGDLQSSFYTFRQSEFSLSGALLYRINNFALRGGITYGKVKGSDAANGLYNARNLSFHSKIGELNLCLQYDVFVLSSERKFTPYVFAGVGWFHFNPYIRYDSQKVYLRPLSTEGQGLSIYPDKKFYSLSQFEIPLGIGFKYRVSDKIQLGLEFCSRYLFTDYLDDVSTSYPDENTLLKERGQLAVDVAFRGDEIDPSLTFPSGKPRGSSKHNDNFYTSVLSFIYVFPERNTLSGLGSNHGKKIRSIECPKLKDIP